MLLLSVSILLVCSPRTVIKPFTTDQCSGGPEGPKDNPGVWCDCCLEHDRAYWQGGTRVQRRQADRALKQCVREHGYKGQSGVMHAAVRIFGSPFLPFPWRWGYGWRYFHAYHELTSEEADSARTIFSREESRHNYETGCSE